jgi:flagellar hook-length control protein FliK
LTELAPALPTTETALTVAREAIAMAADRLVPSTAAPSPTTPDLAAAAAAGPNPSPPGSTVQSPGRLLEVPVPVQHEQWGEALGNRVVWLANRQVQSAELHLNPPELGPVEVQIRMSDKQATLEFSAAQPLVREAIESALPKLREMFSAHGLDLADVNVSQQSPSQSRGEHGTHAAAPGRFAAPDGEPASEPQGQSTPQRLGLVDLYA